MTRYAVLLLALVLVSQGAPAAETDPAVDPIATARFQRALDHARAKAADIPLVAAAITVSTQAATSVGSTAARLNGTLDTGGGLPAFGYFKYGLAANALNTKSPQQLIGGNGATPFLYDLTGLACDTQYFFQAAAEDSVSRNEIVGSVLNFTTTTCGPTATTNPANPISATGATLNASVNPKGAATTVSFLFGDTAALLFTPIDAPSAGSGESAVPISAPAPLLTCNKQYFFRVRAENANGTTQGTTQNFTTSQCAPANDPPDVTTTAASGLTTTGATLNGTVDPNGIATTAEFDWGPNVFLGSVAAVPPVGSGTSPVAISAGLTGLGCGTQYFFRARASSAAGADEGDVLNFTTVACPPSAPGVVTNPATSITAGGATLNGTVDANGTATTAKFEWGSDGVFNRTEDLGSIGNGNSAVPVTRQITELTCGTQYVFRASATNASGTVTGITRNFTTTACPPTPPPTVTTSSATNVERTSATLNGTVDPNGTAATAQFQYGIGNLNQSVSVGAVGSGNSAVPISIGLSDLTCNTTYSFRARATNSGGPGNGATLTFTTSSCFVERPTVTTSAATAIAANGATFNGTVDPNADAATAGFQYGLAANALFSAIPLGSVGAGNAPVPVQATVNSLLCNRPYYFRAFGSNGGGTRFGPTLSFVTGACAVPGPVAITEPVSGLGPIGATLNGTIDPNGSLTTVYFDFGTTPEFGTTVTYAQVNGGTVPVSLPTQRLICDTTYWYRVRAESAGGVSIGGTASFATGPCGGACANDFPLSCGTGDGWSNAFGGATNAVDGYYCNPAFVNTNLTGPEYTYRFIFPETVQATVVLSGLSADLDLFVLNAPGAACNGTNCFASSGSGGTTNESVTFTALAGTEYYVVVEGYAGATSSYSINATCTEPTLAPDVTVGPPSRVTLTEATVGGTVDPNGSATQVFIDYGLSAGQLDRSVQFGNTFSQTFAFGVSVNLPGLVCGNTYYYRVRGVSAAGTDVSATSSFATAPCGAEVCKSDFPLFCGSGDSWGNAQGGSTNSVTSYTCDTFGQAGDAWTGPEYTYFFTPPEAVVATVNLTGLSADLDLWALRTPGGICTGENCITASTFGGTGNESLTFIANQNQTYNINVDGFVGSVSTYSINMTCVPVRIFSDGFE